MPQLTLDDLATTRPRTCNACGQRRVTTHRCLRCRHSVGERGPWFTTQCGNCTRTNWMSEHTDRHGEVPRCLWCDKSVQAPLVDYGTPAAPPVPSSHTRTRRMLLALGVVPPTQKLPDGASTPRDVMECFLCHSHVIGPVWELHMGPRGEPASRTTLRATCHDCAHAVGRWQYWDFSSGAVYYVHQFNLIATVHTLPDWHTVWHNLGE